MYGQLDGKRHPGGSYRHHFQYDNVSNHVQHFDRYRSGELGMQPGCPMRNVIVIAALLFFAGAGQAQTCSTHSRQLARPWTWMESNMCDEDYQAWLKAHPAKRWYKSKQWWAGEALMVGAIAGDARTTSHRCAGCVESNPILGGNPSAKAVYGLAAVNLTVQTTLHWWSYNLGKNDPSAAWRAVSLWGQPVAIGAIGGYFTYNNSQMGYRAYVQPIWIHK